MRVFQASGGSLSKLPAASRRLYGVFLLFTLMAFMTSVALYTDLAGWDGSNAVESYLGNEGDPEAVDIKVPRSVHQMLEQTHFHLFTQPMLYLVLSHLFLLARGGRAKEVWVFGTGAFLLAHIMAPWWVFSGAPGWVMAVTAWPMLIGMVGMALWPLPELWSSSPSR